MFGHRSPGLVSGYRAGICAAYGRSGLYALGAVVATFLGYRFAFERFWSHRDKYAEIARRPTHGELDRSAPCARIRAQVRDHHFRTPQSFRHASEF